MAKIRQAVHSRFDQVERLRQPFHQLVLQYHPGFLETDPLKFAHRYSSPRDRELVAFLSAMFAFGNVRSIFQSLEKIFAALGDSPAETIAHWPSDLPESLKRFQHRWVNAKDLHLLLSGLSKAYRSGSLEMLFLKGYDPDAPDLTEALSRFSVELKHLIPSPQPLSRGLKFLLSSPGSGNMFKRMNLFLRWVVRRAPPDLGIWKTVSPAQLFLPIDTHLARLVRYTGLSRRRKPTGWGMVVEVTASLRLLDPTDPVRFDFALSRLGILDRCRHKADPVCCPICPLREVCVLNRGKF